MGETLNITDRYVEQFVSRFSDRERPRGKTGEQTDKLSADTRTAVLHAVFEDKKLEQTLIPGGTIQASNTRADILNRVLGALGGDPVHVMAMGDIWPTPEVFEELLAVDTVEVPEIKRSLIMERGPRTYSYDDLCKGEPRAREILFRAFASSYGFPPDGPLAKQFIENSSIVEGGMNGIRDVFGSFFHKAMEEEKTPRIICPDSTFAMFWDIVNNTNNNSAAERHVLPTTQKDRLHLTAENVDDFYGKKGADKTIDLWYMIPMGNPSGTYPTSEQFKETCREIVSKNPEAIIVLDCAYVRTMEDEDAQQLMLPIINDSDIMDRVIFIDSLSKTHAVPESRIGVFFSKNPELFKTVYNYDKSVAQGHSLEKSAKVISILDVNVRRANLFREMHRFRGRERQGLFEFLIKSGQFDDLFDADQSHIDDYSLGRPGGIYLFPRMREGVDSLDIAAKTNCLGIPSKLGSRMFLRFAVGRIMDSTYSV